MSRLPGVLIALALVVGAPLAAQDRAAQAADVPARAGDASAPPSLPAGGAVDAPINGIAGILATGKAITDTSDPSCRPENRRSGEIVVCGPGREARDRERYPGGGDVAQGKGVNDGLPRAPSVSGLPGCEHGCIGLGGAPYIPVFIDLNAIPETPKGSDAEKVANGEVRND